MPVATTYLHIAVSLSCRGVFGREAAGPAVEDQAGFVAGGGQAADGLAGCAEPMQLNGFEFPQGSLVRQRRPRHSALLDCMLLPLAIWAIC